MSGHVTGDATTDAAVGVRAGSTEVGAPPQRMAVTGGGEPDPAQLAALVIALTPPPAARRETGPPAWRHAALLEGVGGPAILTHGDLEVAAPRGC